MITESKCVVHGVVKVHFVSISFEFNCQGSIAKVHTVG